MEAEKIGYARRMPKWGGLLRILLFCSVEGGEKQKGLSEKIDEKERITQWRVDALFFVPWRDVMI